MKVEQIKVFPDDKGEWPSLNCQKLSADGTSTMIDSANRKESTINPETRPLCDEGKIGSSCSVSCSSLFHDNYNCQNLLMCDKSGCSCAQGFTMPSCDKQCPPSTYGFECKQKCGHCWSGDCDHGTGVCRQGCEDTENMLFLPPYCTTGIGSPPAPSIEIINSTYIRVRLSVGKDYKILPTHVNFEVRPDNELPPFKSDYVPVHKNKTGIEEFFDELSPGTHYKVFANVQVNGKVFRGEWAHVTTTCTEYVALNFIILNDETSITINTRLDLHVNDYCPYMWYRVQLLKEKEVLFDESTPFPKVFTDLEPSTEYRIVISSQNSNITDEFISTLESVPDRVENLNVLSVSTDKIQLSWKPPIKNRGRLVNYTIVIQAYEAFGCSQFKKFYNLSEKHTELEMQAEITGIAHSQYNHTFYGLRPYTRYQVTVYASTARGQSEKSVIYPSTQPIETPTEVFENLHCDGKQSGPIGATLHWNLPADCSTITGPIAASKLFLRKIGDNFTAHETNSYNFTLEKSKFIGNENYEVLVYALRDFGRRENETAFVGLNFTMPAREPPIVHDLEIIEVDTKNHTITLRWKPPNPPLNGKLDFYSMDYCESYTSKCDSNAAIVLPTDLCKLWLSRSGDICATVPLPYATYKFIQITAYNEKVKEGSEPVKILVQRTELVPSKPSELRVVNIKTVPNITAELTWAHPLKSGDRLKEFQITIIVHNSSLKDKPWKKKNYSLKIDSDSYQPYYSTKIELFPASTFLISVNALTWLNKSGDKNETTFTLSPYTRFDNNDLMPQANESSFISIWIPKIVNDVEGSRLIVAVQGPRYCDEAVNTSENVYPYLDIERSSNKFAWMAASLTEPESYVGKEFRVGDGLTYGDAKNYILCPKEPYIIHLLLDYSKNPADGNKILDRIITSPIYIGKPPRNYATWLMPMILIFVVLALLIFIACRKKFPMNFLRNKPKTKMQENMPENMPLSNDFSRKSKFDEIESNVKIRDTKDPLYDNVFITEKKKTYLMPVKVEDFEEYFESAYKSSALHNEYQTLKSGPTRPCVYGSQREVKPKNRYANLFAYDETRVVLEKIADDPFSDYINANFIKGYNNKEKAYIATQGPKPNTVIDFWRMVWQEKVQIICMMSNLLENGKVKCEEYWPSAIGKKILYGTIAVQFSSEIVHSDFTYRTFRVSSNNQETRTVEHLHYTTWPDHGVPSNPSSIVAFIKKLHRLAPGLKDPETPPILVHCSAGVGRTGTLIVLDIAVQQALAEKVVDVFSIVLSVRSERMNMVDNEEQYLFLHLVLIEYFRAEDTRLVCDKGLAESIREKKRDYLTYYQRIMDTNWWNNILSSSQPTEMSSRNRAKHRFPESAVSINRLYLKRTIITDEDSNYIAATLVKDVFKNCQYITTQLPMPSTLADFWRMVVEFNVEYVLVLQLPNLDDPTYCELVPESQGFASTNYLRVIRQQDSKEELQYYLKEKITIIDSSEQPSKNQVVKIITYKYWPEASLPSPGDLVDLWKVLDDFPKNNQSPIIVACRDGVTVSGLWLTLSYMLKRMTIDKECDIPLAARAIRRCRSDFINKPEHFEYLYDVALAWFDEIFQ